MSLFIVQVVKYLDRVQKQRVADLISQLQQLVLGASGGASVTASGAPTPAAGAKQQLANSGAKAKQAAAQAQV